jgi:hypothetical protein
MDQIVLVKIESLHARLMQEAGLNLRLKGREFVTGTIAAHLDENAEAPANLGLVNLTTRQIRLHWAIIATLPAMADACAAGQISEKELGLVKVSFDEHGQFLKDGSGFDTDGHGKMAAGSVLSSAVIPSQPNGVKAIPAGLDIIRALSTGNTVRCALSPESYIDIAFPKSLGGEKQRLNMIGGFRLVPVMALGAGAETKRTRR